MKIRSCHPFAARALAIAVVLIPGAQACAEPAPMTAALTPAQQAEWEKSRTEGKAAAKAGQWGRAREAYQRAWGLKEDWNLAANLGRAELNQGKLRDAAEHLDYAIHKAPPMLATEAPAEWRELGHMLQRAKARVGALVITVEPAGAEVLVNGQSAGTAPLARPVFVDPGPVVVEARAQGYALGSASLKAAAGKEAPVKISLASTGKETRVEAPVELKSAAPDAGARKGSLDDGTIVGITLASALAVASIGFGATIPFYTPKEGDLLSPRNLCFWSGLGAGVIGGATAIRALARKTEGAAIAVGIAGAGVTLSGKW